MKKLFFIIAAASMLLGSGIPVFGSEGHGAASAAAEFQIGSARVSVSLDPPHYQEGAVPKAVITLTDAMTGSPLIDADVSVQFRKGDQKDAHAGHGVAMPESSEAEEAGGLDFGEASPVSMPYDLSGFTRLQADQKAGVYTAPYPLPGAAEYSFVLAVSSLGSRIYAEPLIYGGKIGYVKASNAAFYRMVFVIGLVIMSGLASIWIIALRRSAAVPAGEKLNLLTVPLIRRFFKSAWFQPVFQMPVLLVFLVIIGAGLFDVQQGDRNIATILMWTIWWAGIIFTFVLMGRVWCMTCPFGAMQDWIGRRVSMNRDFPATMRNIYLPSLIFFVLTWWDGYSGIVNKPALTAWLLIGFFLIASLMALIFKGRAFCRYVCPIGGLIGLYSMFSPVELRNRCMEVCRDHKVKECIKGTDHSHGCPMFVTPMTLDRNNYCNFCSECIKSCSQDNIVIRFRSFAKDLWVSKRGYLDEALLAMVLVGITIVVTGEMVEPWHRWTDAVAGLLPFESLGISGHAGGEKAVATFIFIAGSLMPPLLLLAASGVVKRIVPDAELSVRKIFVQFAYMFIPVGIAMHLAHNISHLLLEGPGIVPAFERLIGLRTGDAAESWTVAALAGSETIFWLQMIVLVALNIFSLYAGYRIAVRHYGDRPLRVFLPMALLAVAFMVINAYILGQPMSLRHTH